jgi:DMSO/TMAO reductase YedYZ molybdopterin-dependent catalytic subunit
VPVTTAIAVAMVGRRIPMVGHGAPVRRASGWDR